MANRIRSSLRAAYILGSLAIGVVAMPVACDSTETTTTGSSSSGSGASGSTTSSGSGGEGGMAGGGQGGAAGQGGMAGGGQGGMAGGGQGGMAGGGQGGMAGGGQGGMAGGGQGGMAGAGGQGGAGVVEDCLNGADDDGDGAVDCMDAECNAGFSCVDAAPAGWTGFVALFQGMPAAEPTCPAAFPSVSPYKGNDMPSAPFTCGACSCGAPTGQTCDLPDLLQVMNAPCGQMATAVAPLPVPVNWTGTCYGPSGWPSGQTCNGSPCNSSVMAPKATVTGGSCPASGGAPNLMPVTWSVLGKACGDAPMGGGCGAGVCQPKAAAPFEPGLCIYKAGDNACPAGAFSQKHVFYEGADDTRACGACSCNTPQGSSCDATISVYTDAGNNQCNTVGATFQAGGCGNLSGNPAVKGRKATTSAPMGGSCTPGVAIPSGTVTPTTATTFCCTP